MTERIYKAKQPQMIVSVSDATRVIDAWVARSDGNFTWAMTPEILKQNIENAATDGVLEYNRASQIIGAAETTKMPGNANRGIDWIRAELRALRRQEDQ